MPHYTRFHPFSTYCIVPLLVFSIPAKEVTLSMPLHVSVTLHTLMMNSVRIRKFRGKNYSWRRLLLSTGMENPRSPNIFDEKTYNMLFSGQIYHSLWNLYPSPYFAIFVIYIKKNLHLRKNWRFNLTDKYGKGIKGLLGA